MPIKRIDASGLVEVQKIAAITWPITFGEILSSEQIAYMMEMMYSEASLLNQLENGHEFYLYLENDTPIGFMGIEANYKGNSELKIHKLYVLPNQQGKGIGEKLILFSQARAQDLKQDKLTLNVNRFNKALGFYAKLGFENVKSEDIEIGNGYLMEDFVLEKQLVK